MSKQRRGGRHGIQLTDPRSIGARLRRGLDTRKDRTPYYITDVPPNAAKFVLHYQEQFVKRFGRDYGDDDQQFWDLETGELASSNVALFIEKLAEALTKSNHHPAHIHAVRSTRLFIFGCGDCLDDCPNCNFRYVPEGWTAQWRASIEAVEKWRAGLLQQPSLEEVRKYS